MAKLESPYRNQPDRKFWKLAVTESNILTSTDLYTRKYTIEPGDKVATAGSCFAQHIAKRLKAAGYNYVDFEPAPSLLPQDQRQRFGYDIYSARFGNIYTTRQLVQLAEEAFGEIPSLPYSWQNEQDLYIDPLRPAVEPVGLRSHEEVLFHRRFHLERVRDMLTSMDLFVFTFGLTETWVCKETGRALPTAPGTIAGSFDPAKYAFHNLTTTEMMADMRRFFEVVQRARQGRPCKFLFTVSPVPLTATATDHHVLVATTYSKSALRAVAGELSAGAAHIDYFPSYEIITAPWSRGVFYESNLRSVAKAGVDNVMRVFFGQHPPKGAAATAEAAPARPKAAEPDPAAAAGQQDDDVVCEEALLEAFSK